MSYRRGLLEHRREIFDDDAKKIGKCRRRKCDEVEGRLERGRGMKEEEKRDGRNTSQNKKKVGAAVDLLISA
jgi:hypothetical protein